MKNFLLAVFILAALAGAAWLLWPRISPYVEQGKESSLVKVREINPLR